jgi:hypothetical protein
MKDGNDISKASVSSHAIKPKKSVSVSSSTVTLAIAFVIVAGLAFWGGTAYQKHHNRGATLTTNRRGLLGGGRFAGGGFGSVTSISSTSITVQNSRSGTSKTFAITSSTKVEDNGASATTSTISTGDPVIVMPSSTNASDAATIIVNPSFGGGFGGPASNSSTSATGL